MKIGCVFQSSVCASTISPIASDLGDPEMQLPLATRVRHSVSVLCSLLIPINCGKVSHGYSAQGQGTPIELVGWRVCENAAHQQQHPQSKECPNGAHYGFTPKRVPGGSCLSSRYFKINKWFPFKYGLGDFQTVVFHWVWTGLCVTPLRADCQFPVALWFSCT